MWQITIGWVADTLQLYSQTKIFVQMQQQTIKTFLIRNVPGSYLEANNNQVHIDECFDWFTEMYEYING